jgi:hypothetical protein
LTVIETAGIVSPVDEFLTVPDSVVVWAVEEKEITNTARRIINECLVFFISVLLIGHIQHGSNAGNIIV